MPEIFETTAINGLGLRNRLVRSATWEGMCGEEGRPTEQLRDLYVNLARGGAGLIITGYTFVRPEGRQLPGTMGIHTDDFDARFRELTGAVHEAGGVICLQLVHCGGQANAEITGHRTLAPSAVDLPQYPEIPDEINAEEIGAIIKAFAEAAERARRYGFDAVQLHGAHGYLINQFLSPLTNRREDEFGGSVENRTRFLLETVRSVRGAVGDDYPLLLKLNISDHLPGGLREEDAIFAARAAVEAGVDAIEASSGTGASGKLAPVRTAIRDRDAEGYNLALAGILRENVSVPVMVVGGFRSYELVERVITEGAADYVSLARPLIREPRLPARWESGDHERARCESCNLCFRPGLRGRGIYCVSEQKERERKGRS